MSDTVEVCHECRGKGWSVQMYDREYNHGHVDTGWRNATCSLCKGTGLVRKVVTFTAHKPEPML